MIFFILRRLILLLITTLILSIVGFCLNYYTLDVQASGVLPLKAYLQYFWNIINGNWGISSINGLPIRSQLAELMPSTMELCLLAFLLTLLVGIPLGIIAGITHNKWQDIIISILILLGSSMPGFLLALLLILYFSLHLSWFPLSERIDLLYSVPHITGFNLLDIWLSNLPDRGKIFCNILKHMILPITTLAVAPTTEVIRLMRINTIEVISHNYIRAAETRGLSTFTIVRRHLLRNTLPPIIPALGIQFSTMLTMTMITELIFSWPGLGRWLIIALRQQDYATISAGVIVIGSLMIFVNILADIVSVLMYQQRY